MTKYSKYSLSKSEKIIIQELVDLGYSFFIEKEFPDCKNPETGQRLRFDFYIPECNLCIEYDGKQHYEFNSELFGDSEEGIQRFKAQQTRDQIKTDYCKERAINLLRIKYSDQASIKNILHSFLSEIKEKFKNE